MKQPPDDRLVFFEPWSLGDVIIAGSAFRELPSPAAIACHPCWHPILRTALRESHDASLIPIELPYTTRVRANPFDTTGEGAPAPATQETGLVLSIRGDLRDLMAARRIFPRARFKMNGWLRFLGRKSALVNLPYALGALPVQNRYRSWARLAGIPFEQIEQTYLRLQANAPRNGKVALHLGAQWRSKQYPHVGELRERLKRNGYEVNLTAGSKDLLPAGVDGAEVTRVVDQQLIDLLRSVEHVITNDSGPMHLAAFLGCRTTALVRASPIEEWRPPATNIIASEKTPRGYRPHKHYMSDNVLVDWPSVATISESLQTRACTSSAGAGQSATISE